MWNCFRKISGNYRRKNGTFDLLKSPNKLDGVDFFCFFLDNLHFDSERYLFRHKSIVLRASNFSPAIIQFRASRQCSRTPNTNLHAHNTLFAPNQIKHSSYKISNFIGNLSNVSAYTTIQCTLANNSLRWPPEVRGDSSTIHSHAIKVHWGHTSFKYFLQLKCSMLMKRERCYATMDAMYGMNDVLCTDLLAVVLGFECSKCSIEIPVNYD